MIDVITGTPGSGKSLMAAYDTIYALQHGRNVIANFEIKLEYFGKKKIARFTHLSDDKNQMTVKNLLEYARRFHKKDPKTGDFYESQTVVYIDECTSPQYFNRRTFGKKEAKQRRVWVAFFQHHRKLGYDILLIAQRDKDIDPQIRSFIEHKRACRAIKNSGLFFGLISDLFGGLFLCITSWYANREECSRRWFVLRKKKANIYNSMKLFVDLDNLIADIDEDK